MSKKDINKAKQDALMKQGALNPHPEKVMDPKFHENDFFDANDIVQVKYEMLRLVEQSEANITDAAKRFGFSRISFYRIKQSLQAEGIYGLAKQQTGPKDRHKLSEPIMQFTDTLIKNNQSLHARAIQPLIKKQFGITVHIRSIERALKHRKKNR
jgi:transposase